MNTIKTTANHIVDTIMGSMKFELEFGMGMGTETWRAYCTVINLSLSDEEKESFYAELKAWKESKNL